MLSKGMLASAVKYLLKYQLQHYGAIHLWRPHGGESGSGGRLRTGWCW